MIVLDRLSVSLTKHGAHKIAKLLRDYPAHEVLDNLHGSIPGISIEEVQAKKNLSANKRNVVPAIWSKIQEQGNIAIDCCTLIAIIFSHHKLIRAMADSSTGLFKGKVNRNHILKDKEYTNFAHTLDKLGFATRSSINYTEYDLERLFSTVSVGPLAKEIIKLKLETAGWDGKGDAADIACDLNFHTVLSCSKENFYSWLSTGNISEDTKSLSAEDTYYFSSADNNTVNQNFQFTSGHTPKSTTPNLITPNNMPTTGRRLHNHLQNELYNYLVSKFGRVNVGTEVATGSGTSIDVAVRKDELFWFYEIKTAPSSKACIRQAIPQLLEYSYWPDTQRASKLIIISSSPIDELSKNYLKNIRTKFGIPIYYEQFCLQTKKIISPH